MSDVTLASRVRGSLLGGAMGRGTTLELADDFISASPRGYSSKSNTWKTEAGALNPDGLNDMKTWLERYPGW